MFIFYVLLFFLFFIDTRPRICLQFNNAYLSKNTSTIIKGIFVILVFFRHIQGYISLDVSSVWDYLFLLIDSYSMQLIVTVFFFYSGYGIVEQIKQKGEKYTSSFFKHRFCPILLSFFICVSFYLIFNSLFKIKYPIKTILLSYIGWDSIGNSNWFMFDTFMVYFFICISVLIFKNNIKKQTILCTILVILLVVFFVITKKNIYWYDTILCFPSGMWWSIYKSKIEEKVNGKWILFFVLILILFFISYLLSLKIHHLFFIFSSIFFCILINFLTMKIVFTNSYIFAFLGNHVFSVYILQRLVFMIVQFFLTDVNKYLFLCISLLITLLMSFIYDYLFEKGKSFFNKK